jgi:hypothetical protein
MLGLLDFETLSVDIEAPGFDPCRQSSSACRERRARLDPAAVRAWEDVDYKSTIPGCSPCGDERWRDVAPE